MLEIPPNTPEHLTGRPNWHHVGAFLGLTFGLTWPLDLLMYWHGGLDTPGAMSVVQLQMLFPAFSAIVLGIGFFPESPLYRKRPAGPGRWFYYSFLLLTVISALGDLAAYLASLSLEGMGASMMIEGAANAAPFEAYLEHILVPSLHPGRIVVMDNLSAHKGVRVRQLIEDKECQLLFLPAYSPDLSPIEEAFSKIKAFLRRVGARTHEALQEAIGQALETVTVKSALGWFTHCGYRSAQASDLSSAGSPFPFTAVV